MSELNIFPDNIIDIRFQGDKSFILKKINITSLELENQLKNEVYSGQNRVITEEVENMKLPPFILAFYKLVFELLRIPSEIEIIEYYKKNYLTKNNDKKTYSCNYQGNTYIIENDALEGRLLRTYPSLIRDFHFYLKCKESKLFDDVKYSLHQDYFDGIDLMLKYNEKEFHISLFVKTKRAKSFKIKKYNRHDYSNANELTLEVDLTSNSKKVSNFYLYSDSVLNEIVEKIKNETK
ncbi:MAG: hypothetical protein RBT49_17390 [Bacteroidales bacterium]|jgi:hypothetical protein|nr:hypothetical protein [Bacteroidales bacterium]